VNPISGATTCVPIPGQQPSSAANSDRYVKPGLDSITVSRCHQPSEMW
jgi:hypothetical protein